MKKTLSLILALCFVFLLSACVTKLGEKSGSLSDLDKEASSSATSDEPDTPADPKAPIPPSDTSSPASPSDPSASDVPAAPASPDNISAPSSDVAPISPNQPAEYPDDLDCTPDPVPDPDVVVAYKIVDTSAGLDIAFAQAIEEVYEDSRAVYCFSCIKSHYITVYFTDGSEMNIKDALNSGLLTVDEAKALGIRFIEESKNLVDR